jgi:hypothetical protein
MRSSQTSGLAMISFIRQGVREKKINDKTGTSVVSAVRRIIETVYGDLGRADIPTMDVDATLKAFEQKEARLGAGTLQSYRSRFHMAVRWFMAYLKDPATWQQAAPEPKGHEVPLPANGFVDYKLPIRGATGHLVLPRALTGIEADRVAAFVRTLVEEVA